MNWFYYISATITIAIIAGLGYYLYYGPYLEARKTCETSVVYIPENEGKYTVGPYGYNGMTFRTEMAAIEACAKEQGELINRYGF